MCFPGHLMHMNPISLLVVKESSSWRQTPKGKFALELGKEVSVAFFEQLDKVFAGEEEVGGSSSSDGSSSSSSDGGSRGRLRRADGSYADRKVSNAGIV
jgi:hypothetical protein